MPSRQGVGTAAQGSARADPYDLARGSAAPLSVRIANTHFGMGYEQECRPRSGFASMRHPAECSAGEVDFDRPPTFRRALEDVDTLFVAHGTSDRQIDNETALIDAAVVAGVSHIVKLSAMLARSGEHALPAGLSPDRASLLDDAGRCRGAIRIATAQGDLPSASCNRARAALVRDWRD